MKILHVVESTYPGSINKRLSRIEKLLAPHGVRQYYAALEDRRIIGINPTLNHVIIKTADDLISLCNKIHPDIIELHDCLCEEYLKICKQYAVVVQFINFSPDLSNRTITTNFGPSEYKISVSPALNQYILQHSKSFDAVFYLANSVGNTLLKANYCPYKIYKCPHFLEKPSKYSHEYSNSLVYTGRLDPQKGIHHIIQALAQIKHLDWNLKIAGTGNLQYTKGLLEFVASEELSKRIKFMGHMEQRDLVPLVSNSKLFLFASLADEAFGYSPAEAMSFGIPIVSTQVGGCEEWLKNNFNGLLVAASNIDEYATTIAYILEHDSLYLRFRKNARLLSESISTDRQVQCQLEIYRSVLEGYNV